RWAEELPERGLDRELVEPVVAFLRDAGPTQRESLLLHQDLHGGNVLRPERGWLAIDAKPLVGEREFDVASLIRDRRPTSKRHMERRLALPRGPTAARSRADARLGDCARTRLERRRRDDRVRPLPERRVEQKEKRRDQERADRESGQDGDDGENG